MLISETKKILFIHIQKTAGISLMAALKEQIPDVYPFMNQHDHAAWAQAYMGIDKYCQYYSFAFVRNPWERLVSWYSMIAHRGIRNRLFDYVWKNANSFDDFVIKCTDIIEDLDGRKSTLYNQLDYISDEQGKIIVNFVGRFEYLQRDAENLFKNIGLATPKIPHLNSEKHRHYSYYYRPYTRDLVAERYQRDIEYFGYTFETAPE